MDNYYNQQSNGSSYSGNGVKAPNIFQQFPLSFVPPQYDRLTQVKTGSMIGFVTLLTLIASIISFVGIALVFASGGTEWVKELPDFEVSGGRLHIDEDFIFDESPMFVFLTEDIDEFTYDDASALAEEGYRTILLAGRDSLSLMQNGEYQRYDFSTLRSDVDLSRDWIVNTMLPIMMVFLVLGYILFFVGRTLWYFLCAAIYLLAALLIAQIMKKGRSAGELFRVAVYSKVLMFVVATLISIVPVHIPLPMGLRIVVTLAFMGFAIAKLPEKN